ncbi:IclR family transcriptional regulator C-terminal domain-containing protein [Streptomyces sp. NBC_00457]
MGKALLSHGGTELIETVLSGELREYSSRSIVAPEMLSKEIGDCRRTGTATVRGELTLGADSVATRIVNAEGRVVAALSVVVRTDSVKHQAVLPSVIASGLGISRLLGWRPGVKVRNS